MTKALILRESEDGKVSSAIETIDRDFLSPHEKSGITKPVWVEIAYSTLNYKDGMVIKGIGKLVRSYPHVPGIDFVGTVTDSAHEDYKAGDKVVLTGWRVGEFHKGGLSQLACVDGSWLVPLPTSLSEFESMTVGTAGFTAMLAIHLLEQQGLSPNSASLPVLVTGATGGVGSFAVSLLSRLGYKVAGVTGKPQSEAYLKQLGCSEIIPREALSEPVKRPLEKEAFSGAIDAVGGEMLGRVLAQTVYGGSVAAIGLAGGNQMSGTVLPFLLRGVRLIGVDSVMCPTPTRIACWKRLAELMPKDHLEEMVTKISLDQTPDYANKLLKGEVQGRVVVDLNQ